MATSLLEHVARVVQDRVLHKLRPERWAIAYKLSSEVPSLYKSVA